MGKDLKGKELGKGISQRADGRYIARFTSKTGKRKTLYDFKLNELKRKLREAVYEDEHGLNGNGESITLNAWYVTWTELYKKKTVKMTTIYKNHSYYNSRVKNSIGKMYLQDIKTYHVQKFINEFLNFTSNRTRCAGLLFEGIAPCCAHNFCAFGTEIPHLQGVKSFSRRTRRRKKRIGLYLRRARCKFREAFYI